MQPPLRSNLPAWRRSCCVGSNSSCEGSSRLSCLPIVSSRSTTRRIRSSCSRMSRASTRRRSRTHIRTSRSSASRTTRTPRGSAPRMPRASTRCSRSRRWRSASGRSWPSFQDLQSPDGWQRAPPRGLSTVGAVTYIIAEPCIDIKDRSCVDVCPVDCIHEADRILVIDPEECIDCGACEPECPVEAIFPEDALPDKWEPFVEINYAYGKGMDVVNQLTQKYADENNVQNEPIA